MGKGPQPDSVRIVDGSNPDTKNRLGTGLAANGVRVAPPTDADFLVQTEFEIDHDTAIAAQKVALAGARARSSQAAGVAQNDAVFLTADLYGQLVLAGYSWAANNLATAESDPVSQHYQTITLADVTNGTDDTYYYYVDMNGFRKIAYQLELDCAAGTVTVTVEGTIQDDGTAPGSCTYQDITNDVFGVASVVAAAGSTSDMLLDNAESLSLMKYVRVKIVAATGGNTGDWTIYCKKLY